MNDLPTKVEPPDDSARRQMRQRTRRSFVCGAAAALSGLAGWAWLKSRANEAGLPWPLRRMLDANETLARALFDPARLAPNFALGIAREPRVNGLLGLESRFDPARWKLRVESPALKKPLVLTIDDIKTLPRVEMVTELKCVEGWTVPVHWGGATLADFAAKFGLATRSGKIPDLKKNPADLFRYVEMVTPDMRYYVGLDIESALHPQTLLCYEMNGEPLTLEHGAPLRLAIMVKYGFKSIKRIGTIRFLDERARDYWAEQGYDWYAGH